MAWVFTVVRVWAGVNLHVQRRLCGLTLPPTPKQGAPSLSYQLAQRLAQREEGVVSLRAASSQTSQDGIRILITKML